MTREYFQNNIRFALKKQRQQVKESLDTVCSEWSNILSNRSQDSRGFDMALDNFRELLDQITEESYQERLIDGKLTEQQRAFVEHYLECGNAAEAVRLAGYKIASAKQQAQDLLGKRHVKAYIERLREEQS